jgi:Tfp pilus assembly protein, ATPase PilM
MAIIDVGASKTTLCLIHEGRPVLLRTVLWGGNHLTHALAVRYACSFAEAERRKRAMAVQEVDTWLEPVLKELRVSLHSYEGTVHQRLSHCWVSGGGSKLKELSGHMARQLGLLPVGRGKDLEPLSPRLFHRIWIGHPSEYRQASLEIEAGRIKSCPGFQGQHRCRLGRGTCHEAGSPLGSVGCAYSRYSGADRYLRSRHAERFDGQESQGRDPGSIRANIRSRRERW